MFLTPIVAGICVAGLPDLTGPLEPLPEPGLHVLKSSASFLPTFKIVLALGFPSGFHGLMLGFLLGGLFKLLGNGLFQPVPSLIHGEEVRVRGDAQGIGELRSAHPIRIVRWPGTLP